MNRRVLGTPVSFLENKRKTACRYAAAMRKPASVAAAGGGSEPARREVRPRRAQVNSAAAVLEGAINARAT